MIKLPDPAGYVYHDDACGCEVAPPTPYYTEAQERIAAIDLEETRATARLIAKAPEMYNLLEELLATQSISFIAKLAVEQLIKEIDNE